LSPQIQRERKAYYDILERMQKRSMDVTDWLAWFLDTLHRAVVQAQHTLDVVLATLGDHGFEGALTCSKWAAIAKCSPDTALPVSTICLRGAYCRKWMQAGAAHAMCSMSIQRGVPSCH
jgi:hypothetical protein